MLQEAAHYLLPKNSIHLWKSDLLAAQPFYTTFWKFLSKEEQARAQRFKHTHHHQRYVICHGQLRQLLARYLNRTPTAIEFEVDKYGKPRLKGSKVDKGFVFNISHSGDYALLGFAWDQRLGVDIEVWRDPVDSAALVRRCFSDTEQHYWNTLKPAQQQAAFFHLWTCKESFVKAIGRGLSAGLDQCVISTSGLLGFQTVPAEYGPAKDWKLMNIECEPGMSAAVTTDETKGNLTYYPLVTNSGGYFS